MYHATTVTPTLQASLLCEDVRCEINGMQTLVGVLTILVTPAMPIGFLKLCLWTRWCNGIGKFHQRSRILAPDEGDVVAESTVSFELENLEAHTTNVHFFSGVQFTQFGHYHVEISCDDQLMTRFSIPVVKVVASPPPTNS